MILYLGDGDMSGAAAYLSGVMLLNDLPFERVDSGQRPSDDVGSPRYDAYVLSDYPRDRFRDGQLERVRDAVDAGAGLLMLGGWESFHGRLGEYHDTVLAELLPVEMLADDDRRNFAQPVMVCPKCSHPILDGLPWNRPPFVGGFNQFKAKRDSETLLEAICCDVRLAGEDRVADCDREDFCRTSGKAIEERVSIPLPNGSTAFVSMTDVFPMLVVGHFGRGKTAALATDVAPHWIGGFVDWGAERVAQDLPGGDGIEVGSDYAKFFAQLIRWIGTP